MARDRHYALRGASASGHPIAARQRTTAGRARRAVQAGHPALLRANKGTRFRPIWTISTGDTTTFVSCASLQGPMTGKDEWRIIHMQGGVLTDSLLNKPKTAISRKHHAGQNISATGLGETASAGQRSERDEPAPADEGGTRRNRPDGSRSSRRPGNGTQPDAGPGGTAPSQPPGTPACRAALARPLALRRLSPFPGMPGAPVSSQASFRAAARHARGTNAGNTGDSGSTVGGYVRRWERRGDRWLNPAMPAARQIRWCRGRTLRAEHASKPAGNSAPNGAPPGLAKVRAR